MKGGREATAARFAFNTPSEAARLRRCIELVLGTRVQRDVGGSGAATGTEGAAAAAALLDNFATITKRVAASDGCGGFVFPAEWLDGEAIVSKEHGARGSTTSTRTASSTSSITTTSSTCTATDDDTEFSPEFLSQWLTEESGILRKN